MSSVSPGWYKDPAEPTTQRYWDGEGWIGAPLPADATPPDGPPEVPPPPPESPAPEAPAPTSPATPGYGQPPPTGYGTPPPAPNGQAHQGYGGPAYPPVQTLPPPAPVAPIGVPLASPGLRLVARLIDIAAVLLLNVVVNGWFVYQYVQEVLPFYREFNARAADGESFGELMRITPSAEASRLQLVILIIACALWFAYEVPAVANTGQTLGKRLVGLRVVRVDGQPKMGFGRSLRRWNILGLPMLFWTCCVGFIWQFVECLWLTVDRPLHQALHDKAARTVVVVAHPRTPAGASPPPPSPGGPS
ncbi:RDD family protein [Asanoa sp. WMMD1127]|uniref:RDD family protein n=1 Tax=Asanoa sp. WMMD1127 TaxID=3016107 RepID=UPI0024178655|nr:RDD family protein [Asanoa sp. WMMD1127]MDG4822466.1 RDD family protein [Asanoa sp. WMMD1127]